MRKSEAARRTGLRTITLTVTAVAVGAGLGWLCSRYIFVGSWWALVLWAAAGVGIGLAVPSWWIAAITGALYGFVLGFIFMIAGYAGSAPLGSVLLPFAVLGAIAAIGGIACVELGYLLRRVTRSAR